MKSLTPPGGVITKMSENIINNKAIASLVSKAAPQVVNAIKTASARTGVNFAYLMEQAAAESSFNAKAKSRSSSASGLYQFLESTWLDMVKRYGDKHGLGDFSDAINSNGKVTSKALRREILDMRNDPEKAALFAAEFAAENKRYLEDNVGGEIGSTELYLAHFLGPAGAAGFLKAHNKNPLATAADIFPKAARANYNVFYDRKTGEARSLAGVYDFFAKKFGGSDSAPVMTAAAQEQTPQAAPRPRMTYEQNMQAYVMRPFAAMQEDDGWRSMPSARISALTMSPADIMMMAQMKLPEDEQQEQHSAYRQARHAYNQ